MEDQYRTTGYNWEGKIYNGAKYIKSSRELSPERKKIIQKALYELFETDPFGCFKVFQWNTAERILINEKKLEGYPPKMIPALDKMRRKKDVVEVNQDEKTFSKVIDFNSRAAEIQAERLMNSFTAEQKLKLQILETMFSIEK